MKVPHNWEVSTEAVLAFKRFCVHRRWPAVETPQQDDFGKDISVDITDDNFTVTGMVFAAQVKGGASYRRADGWAIPVGDHARQWARSTVPVVGISWDPDEDVLRWVNLTQTLRDEPDLDPVIISPEAALSDEGQVRQMLASVAATVSWGHIPFGLASRDFREQLDAVWDCFSIGRGDPYALVALRRCFLALGPPNRASAVAALAHCTPHPDIPWTKDNWLPPPVQKAVCLEMRWSIPELQSLVQLVDPETGLDRGSLGQSIYMLAVEDPDHPEKLIEAAVCLSGTDPDAAAWAALMAVHKAREDPHWVWQHIRERAPLLAETRLGDHIGQTLAEHGCVWLD